MKDVVFGQIYPVDSPVHRADARAKFIVMIVYIVTVIFADSFMQFALIALLLLAVVLMSRVPPLKVLGSLKAIIVLAVVTFIFTVLLNKGNGAEAETLYVEFGPFCICGTGLMTGGFILCRIVLLVLGPTMVTLTTTPVDMADAIEFLLAPLKLFRVPVHAFGMIMSIALRMIPTLFEETSRVMNAQKARGACLDHGNVFKRIGALVPVLIPLFISAFKRSADLADAMESRCYNGGKGKTRMKVLRFKASDIIVMLLSAALLFFILVCVYNWWGWGWIGFFRLGAV
ncbi:MAG TPA: energy-coupling factor transporter transmembrane protein EcfT [Candidatus Protoclostridium stercorigallinarum]|uniref:Energy-coupling factor transporter transmembrane protein EcfT n=1 Tax=Candidatus Protoclostridium stercorigallinarum TaxID=2838741 RepID=A0A9D1TQV0_9FIRM|nr:energy-coupling factor transporter transmembrane protein EcfT [Candidatus Protoclostridium stercorigallinarum]